MAAILSDKDLFDFDGYSKRITELGTLTESWAQSTVVWVNRIRASYDTALKELEPLKSGLNSLSVSSPGAEQKLNDYLQKIGQVGERVSAARQSLSTLSEAQRLNQQVVTELTNKLVGLNQRFQALDPSAKDYQKQQRAILSETKSVTRAIDAQSKSLQHGKSAIDATERSYNQLNKQTNELRATLKNTADAFDPLTGKINQHNRVAVEMQRQIEINSKALLAADRQMGQSGRNVGFYSSGIKDLAGSMTGITSVAAGVTVVFTALKAGLDIIQDMERYDATLRAVSRDTNDFSRSQQLLTGLSDELGLKYGDLVDSYKNLKAATKDTALEGRATEKIYSAIATAGAKLRLSNEAVEGSLRAVSKMVSSGNVQMDELRSELGEHLPGALRLMSEALGISQSKLNKMVESGQILAVDVLPKFAVAVEGAYGLKQNEKVQNLTASTNRFNNEVAGTLQQLNSSERVTKFFQAIYDGFTQSLKGLKVLVNDASWSDFFTVFGAGSLSNRLDRGLAKDKASAEFAGLDAGQRKKKLAELNAQWDAERKAGDNVASTKTREILRKLRDDDLKASVRDIQEAKRKEGIAEKEAIDKNETDLVRFQKQAVRKRTAEIIALEKQLKADPKNEALSHKLEVYSKLDSDQKAKDKEVADRLKKPKALSDSTILNNALGNSKGRTDVKLADLSADRQDGLISEQDFIEKRKAITIAGIVEREGILTKAGKKETDDYKKLLADKINAETQYEKDSLKLQLSNSKSTTSNALSGIGVDKSEGLISEQDYVEKKNQITIGGINDQLRILEQAGQSEGQLAKDLRNQILETDKAYYRERLKAAESSWKKDLEVTQEALKAINNESAENLSSQLNKLELNYQREEQKVKLAVAKRSITEEQGEAQVFVLKQKYLSDSMAAVAEAHEKEEKLAKALTDDKIKQLEAWKEQAIRTPAEILAAEAEIALMRAKLEGTLTQKRKAAIQEIHDFAIKAGDSQGEHAVKVAETTEEKRKKLLQGGLDFAASIGDSLSNILQSSNQRDIDRLDRDKDKELSLVGDNADAKAKIEEQYNKRKTEIQRKAALQERQSALFSIAINTAQAIMSVLSTGGGARYLDFGASAGILSAFVTAAGISQAAAVLSQPLPAYKHGKLATDTYSGPALAGEAGTELYVDREGASQLLDRPTIINTKPGDRVYTAQQTSVLINGWQKQQRVADLIQEGTLNRQSVERLQQGRLNQQVIIHQLAGQQGGAGGVSEGQMERAFGRALDKRPSRTTIVDSDGQHEYYEDLNNRTEYLNRRHSLPK